MIVTDQKLNAVLCISGEDGEINTRKVPLKGKTPQGITFDNDGNIYNNHMEGLGSATIE